jgi:hypothetical protein
VNGHEEVNQSSCLPPVLEELQIQHALTTETRKQGFGYKVREVIPGSCSVGFMASSTAKPWTVTLVN